MSVKKRKTRKPKQRTTVQQPKPDSITSQFPTDVGAQYITDLLREHGARLRIHVFTLHLVSKQGVLIRRHGRRILNVIIPRHTLQILALHRRLAAATRGFQSRPLARTWHHLDYLSFVWLCGLVVSVLGIRARGSGFESRIAPLSTIPLGSNLGQVIYTHCLPSFSTPRNWGTKRSFRRLSGYGDWLR